jgi:fucose 4-O-acetylase-like acetyltransferase
MQRDIIIDRLRGLAIVLMILDHALAVYGTGGVLRWTVTRASLPLFMLSSGWVMRNRDWPSARRAIELVLAAGISTVLVRVLPGMARVDVLVVYLVALTMWPIARRFGGEWWVFTCVVLGALPVLWHGYHPLVVVGLMVAGPFALENGTWVRKLGESLPAEMEVIGRWPLTLYVGHLAMFVLIREGVRIWG